MANRRKLKKTMQFIASELMTDVFFKTLLSPTDITAKADKLAVEISKMSTEFRARANHYDSKNNPKLVKDCINFWLFHKISYQNAQSCKSRN